MACAMPVMCQIVFPANIITLTSAQNVNLHIVQFHVPLLAQLTAPIVYLT